MPICSRVRSPQPFDLGWSLHARYRRPAASCPPPGSPSTRIVKGLVDPFLAAQLGHAVLAAQTCDHDPDLVLSREVSPGCPSCNAYRLLRFFRLRIDSISSPVPSSVIDEPKTLSSSIARNCPTCADGEQAEATFNTKQRVVLTVREALRVRDCASSLGLHSRNPLYGQSSTDHATKHC
jgi:hypothetical protein